MSLRPRRRPRHQLCHQPRCQPRHTSEPHDHPPRTFGLQQDCVHLLNLRVRIVEFLGEMRHLHLKLGNTLAQDFFVRHDRLAKIREQHPQKAYPGMKAVVDRGVVGAKRISTSLMICQATRFRLVPPGRSRSIPSTGITFQ